MIDPAEQSNLGVFLDCLSSSVIARLSPTATKSPRKRTIKGRKNEIKPVLSPADRTEDVAELTDFIEYLAEEIFLELPEKLRTISYAIIQDKADVANKYSVPLETDVLADIVRTLPVSVSDSLCSYSLIEEPSDLERFLEPILTNYITTATAPPPEYTPALSASRPDGCEICEREHVPLTYHHLIPRQSHAKAVKRGWHKEWELNKVAWLCRACHSYVHKIATNDELAKELYDVELLLQREDVQKFAAWVGSVRWRAR